MSSTPAQKAHQVAKDNLFKSIDALNRARNALQVEVMDSTTLRYVLTQVAKAMAWQSEARQMLEEEQARRGLADAEELARKRIGDPAYTPSVNEALADPNGFMDGFREG